MNGYKVVFVMIIHGIIEGCLQESREKQHHLNILRSSKRFFGNQPTYHKREVKVVEQLPRRPRLRMFDMKLASRTGISYVKKKAIKAEIKGSLALRDRVSKADAEESQIPYIVLPPNNVLPDDEKKVSSTRNTITTRQIPATVIPILITAGPPSTIHIPTPTAIPLTPTTHTPRVSSHPTPQPVNINLVLPTVRPVVQTALLPVNPLQHAEESNVTKIDLTLNIGEEHVKEKPVIIQLPTPTPPTAVVASQLQKAQELNSQLSMLANSQVQRAFQTPPFLNSPSLIATLLGMRNPYTPMSIEEMMSQNGNPQGYPLGIPPPNVLPFQGMPGLSTTLQQGLMGRNSPLTGFPNPNQLVKPNTNQLLPTASLSSLLSNAIKTSMTQSQPDLITSALNQAASEVQAKNQPPQTLTSALTQALAKVVSQNTEPSEEQKLTQVLAAALNSAKTQESQKRFIPTTASSLKVEIVNPTNQPIFPDQMSKQGRFVGPAEQQIISLNVSPLLPQQNPASALSVLPQQIPGNAPPVLPQQNPASALPVLPQQIPGNAPPVLPQQNPASALSVLPQQNPGNAPPVLPQQNPASAPPVLPQQNPASAPPVVPQQNPASAPPVVPQQNPASAPPVVPQQNPASAPPVVPQQNPASAPPVVPQQNPASAPPVVPQQNPVNAPPVSPAFDQISATALGKAMAKALVRTAKKLYIINLQFKGTKYSKATTLSPFPFACKISFNLLFSAPVKEVNHTIELYQLLLDRRRFTDALDL